MSTNRMTPATLSAICDSRLIGRTIMIQPDCVLVMDKGSWFKLEDDFSFRVELASLYGGECVAMTDQAVAKERAERAYQAERASIGYAKDVLR